MRDHSSFGAPLDPLHQ
jgi:hypothetical protein